MFRVRYNFKVKFSVSVRVRVSVKSFMDSLSVPLRTQHCFMLTLLHGNHSIIDNIL